MEAQLGLRADLLDKQLASTALEVSSRLVLQLQPAVIWRARALMSSSQPLFWKGELSHTRRHVQRVYAAASGAEEWTSGRSPPPQLLHPAKHHSHTHTHRHILS